MEETNKMIITEETSKMTVMKKTSEQETSIPETPLPQVDISLEETATVEAFRPPETVIPSLQPEILPSVKVEIPKKSTTLDRTVSKRLTDVTNAKVLQERCRQ